MKPSRDIDRLLEIMAALRTPGTGCPWDLEQTFETIVPFTLEEAYEVADAVERGDYADLRDELGDLLLQVVFHARMAEEEGRFDFGGVVEAITAKLIRRHPHVFGEMRNLSPSEVKALWGDIKVLEKQRRAAERAAAGAPPEAAGGARSGVPAALPALTRALTMAELFDRLDADGVPCGPVNTIDQVSGPHQPPDLFSKPCASGGNRRAPPAVRYHRQSPALPRGRPHA